MQANTRDAIEAAATGAVDRGAEATADGDAAAIGASAPGALQALAALNAAASTATTGQRTTGRSRLRGQWVMGLFNYC